MGNGPVESLRLFVGAAGELGKFGERYLFAPLTNAVCDLARKRIAADPPLRLTPGAHDFYLEPLPDTLWPAGDPLPRADRGEYDRGRSRLPPTAAGTFL